MTGAAGPGHPVPAGDPTPTNHPPADPPAPADPAPVVDATPGRPVPAGDAGPGGAAAPAADRSGSGDDADGEQPAGSAVGVAAAPRSRWLTAALLTVIAVALVTIGGAVSVLTGIGRPHLPGTDSVDAGFARDMATHHEQAIHMAQVARDRSTDPAVRLLAYDIETGQLAQTGQLRGWLQSWRLSQQSGRSPMAWMGDAAPRHGHDAASADGALMPGMATTTEINKLRSMSGAARDVLFLQLMLRHHQGGLPMARYAAEHARVGYVRDLAGKVVDAQSGEVVLLERMLRERGGTPLPPPT